MRPTLVALMVVAGSAVSNAYADTGTYHRCPIEGEAPAEVYMDAGGRNVTFDVRGERHEIRAQGGRFNLRVGPRLYAFDPRFGHPPGLLIIATLSERRTVQCVMP